MHLADVKTSQTWTAAASPHVVGQSINVLGNSTLTIEPCATVLLDPAATIAVGTFGSSPADRSAVVALGTQAQPITFGPHGSSPWGSLYLNNDATATLSWVTFTGGGDVARHGASLILESGNATTTLLPMARVNDVTVTKSNGLGVWMGTFAAFADGSANLTLTGNGTAADPYPIEVELRAAQTLPSGTYTGNRTDEIWVESHGYVTTSAALRDHGVPYRMDEQYSARYEIAAATVGAPAPVLTIDPGVTLRFAALNLLHIGFNDSAHPLPAQGNPASLVALGTAAKPIVFTSASSTPAPGDWQGLLFQGSTTPATQLDHVRIEYAGATAGFIGFGCPVDSKDDASIAIQPWAPATSFLTNSAIVHGREHGVLCGWDAPVSTDFKATNTFDVGGCAETMYKDGTSNQVCPAACR